MKLPVVCSCLLLLALAGFTQSPGRYEVVIHEIMPKPSPVAGLPPYEYIELRNVSHEPVQLKDCWLAVNKREIVLPACLLEPDSMLVLCTPAAVSSYNIPNIRGVERFPALADDSALIVLYDPAKKVIHAIDYNQGWYGNTKPKGGISLEMINAGLPCSGKINWRASTAVAGGTPGKFNAVAALTTDNTRPDLLFATITDSLQVLLQFSKTLDSTLAADPAHYQLSGGIKINSCKVLPPLFTSVQLQLSTIIHPGENYVLSTAGLAGCNGEVSGTNTSFTLGAPQLPLPQDVVINEILFYPPPGVPEFIEIYNRSHKAIELSQLYFCAVKTDGKFETFKRIAATGRLLMPGQFLAITTDATGLCSHYVCKAPENIQEVSSLPSMPMAAGKVALLSTDSTIIDELPYTDGQHFPLASELKGISLERLKYDRPAASGDNWHSAAATAGYATPGAPNSQRWPEAADSLNIVLDPAAFTPDQDG
ncbi:lamin tail domain-containing protein, partial [Chitinophaga sp.]|uniref:lamin tail domain-containing protein n=1 Tax=Chitinophaga sp. TaxID=1869181 RepID=UPI002F954FD3